MASLVDIAGNSGRSAAYITLILILISTMWFGIATYSAWRRLRHIPGPPWASLSRLWMLRNTLNGNMHLATKQACKDFGSLVRIGPNNLVTADPDVLRRLWAVRSPFKKGPFYRAVRFNPERDNLISMRDDHEHSTLRAKMAAGYAGKENEGLEATIDKEIAGFIDLLERKYISNDTEFNPADLARKIQYLTLDVITSLAFGQRFGYTDQDTDVYDYIKITEDTMVFMMILSVFPKLALIMQSKLLRRYLPSELDRTGLGKFIGVAKRVVSQRISAASATAHHDMLASFLAHGLTPAEAEGEILVAIMAGSDTTATALRTTLLHTITSPPTYARLAAEIRSAAAEGKISSPITDSEARGLPYLQAVIKEGLRINPPIVGTMDVVVPKGGDSIGGQPIPEGTVVGCSMFGVQHSESVYGVDAEMFRPERWAEAEGEQLKTMEKTLQLVFKYGKWQCLGKDVALIELNKVFVELLRRYDIAIVKPGNPWSSYSAGIFIQSGMMVRITRV